MSTLPRLSLANCHEGSSELSQQGKHEVRFSASLGVSRIKLVAKL
jgi:hypothetical protein